MRKIAVFPGWGYPNKFFKDIFVGYEIDIIKPEDKICRDYDLIVAWSMGAIDFCMRERINFKKVILVAPAENFLLCSNKRVIERMKKALILDKYILLLEFLKNNFFNNKVYEIFIERYKEELKLLDEKELLDGLDFLINAQMNKNNNLSDSIVILLGENDKIINNKISYEFVSKIKNSEVYKISDCGHNVMFEKKDEFLEIVGRYIDD